MPKETIEIKKHTLVADKKISERIYEHYLAEADRLMDSKEPSDDDYDLLRGLYYLSISISITSLIISIIAILVR